MTWTKAGKVFVMDISNLPPFLGANRNELKRRLASIDVMPKKLKFRKRLRASALFGSEGERADALTKCDGHVWEGQVLSATKVGPSESQTEGDTGPNKKSKMEDMYRNLHSRTVLRKQPYEEQLATKEERLRNLLLGLGSHIENHNSAMQDFLLKQRKENSGLCCRMDPIKASPELCGYRNKYEIGRSPKDKNRGRVGYEADVLITLSTAMKNVTEVVQQYIEERSIYPRYVAKGKTGNWRQATARTNQQGEVLVVLRFHRQDLAQDKILKEQEKVKEFFQTGPGSKCGITSLYFTLCTRRLYDDTEDVLLFGKECIMQDLLGMEFKITPTSHFRVNTPVAEILYSTVAEWCDVTRETMLLDICGSGTLGITMARAVRNVVGVEMSDQAVHDSQINAQVNGLLNVEFVCQETTDFLQDRISRLGGTPIVAVVHQQKQGLRSDVFSAIRQCPSIKRLVLVCESKTKTLRDNIIALTREESEMYKGKCLCLVRSVVVDKAPYMDPCDFVMLFDRWDQTAESQPTSEQATVKVEKGEKGDSVSDFCKKIEEQLRSISNETILQSVMNEITEACFRGKAEQTVANMAMKPPQ